MYRLQGLILYKQIIRDNHIRNVIFTQEYGKITAWEKWVSKSDIGSIVELMIERRNGQNTIKKISLIKNIPFYTWSYEAILEYLCLLKILYQTLPEWVEQRNIYDITLAFTKKFEWVWNVWIILIAQFISLKILGYISHESPNMPIWINLQSIINAKSMKSIPFESYLWDDEKRALKIIIQQAIHSYSFHP